MREAVAHHSYLRALLQHGKLHGLLESIDKGIFLNISDTAQRIEGELPPDNGGHGKQLITLRAEQGQALADNVPQPLGDAHLQRGISGGPPASLFLRDESFLGEVANHLLHEERIALRLAVYRLGQPPGYFFPGDALQHTPDLVGIEPAQQDAAIGRDTP
ncbi:hypothetical protein ES708_34589 [subsurface metagenome]